MKNIQKTIHKIYTPPKITIDSTLSIPLPNLLLIVRNKKLVCIDWLSDDLGAKNKLSKHLRHFSDSQAIEHLQLSCPDCVVLYQAIKQLDEYFLGTRKLFNLPLVISGKIIDSQINIGTPFTQKVWQQLCTIDYGKTISYKELAARVGNDKAYRAVANANGKNPLSIVVPCHRVIAADGSVGGYTGGVAIKQALLEFEKANIAV